MQELVVIIAITLAVFFLARRFWRGLRGQASPCGCGCSQCPTSDHCSSQLHTQSPEERNASMQNSTKDTPSS